MIVYSLIFSLRCLGLFGLVFCENLLKKLMALNIVQVSIILFYLSLAYKSKGLPPIYHLSDLDHTVNPLPHALMLTAIVVGIATTGLGLALLIRIQRHFGSLNESKVRQLMREEKA
mgnify:CR=1 FL=1